MTIWTILAAILIPLVGDPVPPRPAPTMPAVVPNPDPADDVLEHQFHAPVGHWKVGA
ncbi:putative secreted protein [Rhodococcus phage Mbo2]|uniref:Secreted protein n=1 Tax=Rhodococcus phage Mbo2 TaxID=2936911 RepID=A0A9E7IMD4_9CAUD|nr:putative secreted protein [Rhodococcus phage Mbo2]